MAEYEEKFIVINNKVLARLNNNWNSDMPRKIKDELHPNVVNFQYALRSLNNAYAKVTGKELIDNKYIICNQDEPYADEVLKVILDGESEKELKNAK